MVSIHCVAGTSVGAIIGAMYANGYSPDEILEIILKAPITRSMRPAWTWRGLLSLDGLKSLLLAHLPHNNFESLRLPLTVAATEIRMGKSVYFSSGALIPALQAEGISHPVDRALPLDHLHADMNVHSAPLPAG